MLGQGNGFVAQGVHRRAGLGQPLDGETSRPPKQRTDCADVAPAFQQRVGRLELDGQRAQGMREHVVDLAADPIALSQSRGTITFSIGAQPLGEQRLGLGGPVAVLAAAGTA